eukprot:m.147754 g.147754  ORF g.147754 m.147754 type:complete len:569 (+) comp30559_c0_seq1:93-1799(+)
MESDWVCAACTYRHVALQNSFLQCAVCGATRANNKPYALHQATLSEINRDQKYATATPSNSSSRVTDKRVEKKQRLDTPPAQHYHDPQGDIANDDYKDDDEDGIDEDADDNDESWGRTLSQTLIPPNRIQHVYPAGMDKQLQTTPPRHDRVRVPSCFSATVPPKVPFPGSNNMIGQPTNVRSENINFSTSHATSVADATTGMGVPVAVGKTLADALVRPRSDPIMQSINGRKKYIPDHMLRNICPATIVRNALPQQLADDLLKRLMSDATSWNSCQWTVNGIQHTIPRTAASYWLDAAHRDVAWDPHSIDPKEYKPEPTNKLSEEHLDDRENTIHQPIDNTNDHSEDSEQFQSVATADTNETSSTQQVSIEVQRAGECITEIVQKLRPNWKWRPTLALGNCYKDEHSCVGWHADHLSVLGPRPIIVGLSVGATRSFGLRKMTETTNTVSIPMPHNTVVIMWDDCQENWQHAVLRTSAARVKQHPWTNVGKIRLSLTFRMSRPELAPLRTTCYCKKPAALKSKDGIYFSFCSPVNNAHPCRFWQRCNWAQIEAQRLKDLDLASKQNLST